MARETRFKGGSGRIIIVQLFIVQLCVGKEADSSGIYYITKFQRSRQVRCPPTYLDSWYTGPSLMKKQEDKRRLVTALTVKNILMELKDVDWGNLCCVVQLPDSQQTRIEDDYDVEEIRRNEAVLFWLNFHPFASWRLLIKQLDDCEEHSVAECLHSYAEKLSDPSLTHENITLVTKAVEGSKLEDILMVPLRKHRELQQQRTEHIIKYFIEYSPYASWSFLAGRLYYLEQPKALSVAMKFIKETPEPSLTQPNLTTLLDGITDDWFNIGKFMNIPPPKRNIIAQLHVTNRQRSHACWQVFVTEHPFPTWQLLAEGLYKFDYIEELEVVKKEYLKGKQGPRGTLTRQHFTNQDCNNSMIIVIVLSLTLLMTNIAYFHWKPLLGTTFSSLFVKQDDHDGARCHEVIIDDIPELIEIIRGHSSAKLWCMYLDISDSTCNQIDFSPQHHDDVIVDITKAYLEETLKPCWEDIVRILCRHLKKKKLASELSHKHHVNYSAMCHDA